MFNEKPWFIYWMELITWHFDVHSISAGVIVYIVALQSRCSFDSMATIKMDATYRADGDFPIINIYFLWHYMKTSHRGIRINIGKSLRTVYHRFILNTTYWPISWSNFPNNSTAHNKYFYETMLLNRDAIVISLLLCL